MACLLRPQLTRQFPPHRRWLHSSSVFAHENPLGLPRSSDRPAPSMPRRNAGPIQKRKIPHVKHVVAVASGKGGVGKSTVSVNLAYALAATRANAKIGILDLDVFGPSTPKLMGLENIGEPDLTDSGALVPMTNNGIPTMSMGYLLPQSSANDAPIVWRGLMVQKAVQQLLFDVDWRTRTSNSQAEGEGLDVLVVDMPPGTGDVQLTFGQLVKADGAVIVSTPQDVALLDARKGVHMFRKVDIPIFGLVINSAYYRCPSCSEKHRIFGPLDSAYRAVEELGLGTNGESTPLGEVPIVSDLSSLGDQGKLGDIFLGDGLVTRVDALKEVRSVMENVANTIWRNLDGSTTRE